MSFDGFDITAPTMEGSISVTGSGTACAPPDVAVADIAITDRKPSARQALDAVGVTSKKLLTALDSQGVVQKDIQTISLTLYPVYGSSTAAKLIAYEAIHSFSIRIRAVDRIGQLLEVAEQVTGNAGRVNGITFDIEDRSPLLQRARAAAYANARAKAAQYADLSGCTLGELISLTEATAEPPFPMSYASSIATGREASFPIALGEVCDHVTANAVFEIGQNRRR